MGQNSSRSIIEIVQEYKHQYEISKWQKVLWKLIHLISQKLPDSTPAFRNL